MLQARYLNSGYPNAVHLSKPPGTKKGLLYGQVAGEILEQAAGGKKHSSHLRLSLPRHLHGLQLECPPTTHLSHLAWDPTSRKRQSMNHSTKIDASNCYLHKWQGIKYNKQICIWPNTSSKWDYLVNKRANIKIRTIARMCVLLALWNPDPQQIYTNST